MSMFVLYLFVMLDSMIALSVAIAIFSLIAGFIGFMCYLYQMDAHSNWFEKSYRETDEEFQKRYQSEQCQRLIRMRSRWFKVMIIVPLVFGLFATLLPSTKQMAFIYVVAHISQSDMANKIGEKAVAIPDKALEVLNLKMDEYLIEMRGDVKKVSDEAQATGQSVRQTAERVQKAVK